MSRRYLWQPAFHSQCLGAQPGQVVEVPDALAQYQLATVPGVGGQPCLVPVAEDAEPAPVASPKRSRKAASPEG